MLTLWKDLIFQVFWGYEKKCYKIDNSFLMQIKGRIWGGEGKRFLKAVVLLALEYCLEHCLGSLVALGTESKDKRIRVLPNLSSKALAMLPGNRKLYLWENKGLAYSAFRRDGNKLKYKVLDLNSLNCI